jgi:hypothetical protein
MPRPVTVPPRQELRIKSAAYLLSE